jgi:hypothetical protein
VKKTLKWVGAGLLLVLAWAIDMALNRRRAEKTGEEVGRDKEAIDQVKRDAAKGDDGGVLEDFRRATKGDH